MNELKIKTPAKINFGLNIVSKREDGFHNLETLFYPISLFDEISMKKENAFSLTTSSILLNSEQNNSIVKARDLISEYSGKEIKASVTLEKKIPIGAGMGGGSSDGAAALIGFNKLFELGLAPEELTLLALRIGSDAPFFINPIPKAASSRGEIFREVKFLIDKPMLIVNPGIHISTSWAFSRIIPKAPSFHLGSIDSIVYNNFCDFKDVITNDFESVVFPEFSEIENIKKKMYEMGAEFSLMTGSGSSVFGIFPDIISAQQAESTFPKHYFKHIV